MQLAPVKGVGEVAWATPIKKDWRTVPVKEKAEMLIAANKAGLDAGASFMTANLFQVNQQKYFASTDGSYIDQDIHRLWAPITATAVDKATGKFRSRAGLAPPVGMGYEYFDAQPGAQDPRRGRRHHAVQRRLRHRRGSAQRRPPGAREADARRASSRASTTWCWRRKTCS